MLWWLLSLALLVLLSESAVKSRTVRTVQELSVQEKSVCVDAKYLNKAAPEDCSLLLNDIEADETRIEEERVREIASWNVSSEKRVISFGLYGNKPKYLLGGLSNIELAKRYYPGWVCRFYVANVGPETTQKLRDAGAEVVISPGPGHMLSRFLVANDSTVDRFIVRDVDSRLNSRERFAVEEWIRSGLKIHSMRDHINQIYEYNGGMWGAVKGAMPLLAQKIEHMPLAKKTEGMQDIFTLVELWPLYMNHTLAHDSYNCLKYSKGKTPHIHLRPFPTRRPLNYLHVGQVFNENGQPRMTDIDRFMRGVPVPPACRPQGHADWIYG